jgi:hypothetical protein
MKVCFKCGIEKDFSFFYKHKMMGDGYLGKCKECTKQDARKHRDDNLEKVKEYDRNRPNAKERNKRFIESHKKRMENPAYREKVNKQRNDWSLRNTVKRAAHIITGNAIRDSRLLKQPCEVCGLKKNVQAHHDDYEKPLIVRWLCVKHHNEHHKQERDKKRKSTT